MVGYLKSFVKLWIFFKCFYREIIPSLSNLHSHLQNIMKKELFMKLSALIVRLEIRFAKYYNLHSNINYAILTTCFHSYFKLQWILENLEEKKMKIGRLAKH